MPISFRQYDIVAPRKREKLLNLRAPDDSLAYEDDGPPTPDRQASVSG